MTPVFESLEERRMLTTTITSITATPTTVNRGAKVVLSANGVTTDQKSTTILYFVDINGNGLVDGADRKLGQSANAKKNYSISVKTKGAPAGNATVLAEGKDK